MELCCPPDKLSVPIGSTGPAPYTRPPCFPRLCPRRHTPLSDWAIAQHGPLTLSSCSLLTSSLYSVRDRSPLWVTHPCLALQAHITVGQWSLYIPLLFSLALSLLLFFLERAERSRFVLSFAVVLALACVVSTRKSNFLNK